MGTSSKDSFRKYEVTDVNSVEEFLTKYYKRRRYTGRGEEYAACVLAHHKESLAKDGWFFISRHESNTGDPVSYYQDKGNQMDKHFKKLTPKEKYICDNCLADRKKTITAIYKSKMEHNHFKHNRFACPRFVYLCEECYEYFRHLGLVSEMKELTLNEATKRKIRIGKAEFHFYVKELGIDKAREMILANSCITELTTYVINYRKEK